MYIYSNWDVTSNIKYRPRIHILALFQHLPSSGIMPAALAKRFRLKGGLKSSKTLCWSSGRNVKLFMEGADLLAISTWPFGSLDFQDLPDASISRLLSLDALRPFACSFGTTNAASKWAWEPYIGKQWYKSASSFFTKPNLSESRPTSV